MKGDNNILNKGRVVFPTACDSQGKGKLPILLTFITHLCVPNQHAVYKIKALFYLLNNLSVKLSCCLSNRHVIFDLCDSSFG